LFQFSADVADFIKNYNVTTKIMYVFHIARKIIISAIILNETLKRNA